MLGDPQVRAGLRCGPLTLPNHKLVPDSRWIADLPDDARASPAADPHERPRIGRGVALYVTQPLRALQAGASRARPTPCSIQVPPAGFERVDSVDVRCYTAYVAVLRAGRADAPAAPLAGRLAARARRRARPAAVGLKHGLPYVYNADENAHFVPRAIGMFGHGFNPHYFVNPPAYTYLAAPRASALLVRRPREAVGERVRGRPRRTCSSSRG